MSGSMKSLVCIASVPVVITCYLLCWYLCSSN